jgi:small-conductance mechanosensitive channel
MTETTTPASAPLPDQQPLEPAPSELASSDSLWVLSWLEQIDAASPLLRLQLAGLTIAIGTALLISTRFLIRRRLKHLESVAVERFRPLRLQRQDLVTSEDMRTFWLQAWRTVGWLFTAGSMATIVTGLLMLSTFTLNIAARIITVGVNAVIFVWDGFVGYLPNLFTILVILVLARFLVHITRLVFEGIGKRRIQIHGFYPEWAETSFSLIRVLIYAMTAVIIFPYLPGSSSPAFQGISIFVGVLVSLGSTTAVANVVAGIVLTYTRAFRVGDQVEIADTRGRIVESATFVTRIQTLKNVIVSIPNSMVLSNNIINYSKNMGQHGLLVHTRITIGYDVPWQKVNALLLAAAHKTDLIAEQPEAFVLQVSLEDNYVCYEINAWTHHPEQLPKIYSDLHANVLDEFHGHNVEITSPQFRAVRNNAESTIPDTPDPVEPHNSL